MIYWDSRRILWNNAVLVVQEAEMVHSCPVCKVALEDKVYDGVTFSECSQCSGVWILEDDLRNLESENLQDLDHLDLSDVPIQPAGSPTAKLACPECGQEMEQFHFMVDTPILLHRCDSCDGIWIDHGELAQMEAAIGVANRPPTAEEIALANQARKDWEAGKTTVVTADEPAPGAAPRTESEAELQFDQAHAAELVHYQAIGNVWNVLFNRIGHWL